MRNKKRSVLIVLVVLALALVMGACTPTQQTQTSSKPTDAPKTDAPQISAGTQAPPTGGEADGFSYPMDTDYVLKILRYLDKDITLAGYSTYADCPGFKAWQEQTGIKVEITEPADETALLLQLSSGDLPDIVVGGKEFYAGGHGKMVDDGVAQVITEDLPKYAPAYWEFINSDPLYYNSAASVIDNKTEFIAFASNAYPLDSPYRYFAGMIGRKDLMDKLGYTTIKTADQFYNFLKDCKEKEGIKIPLIGEAGRMKVLWNDGYVTSPFGLVTASQYQVDGKYHYGAYEPEFKGVLEWLNMLYNEGLMDPNFAVTDNATAMAAMASGESAVASVMCSRFQTILSSTQIEGFDLTALPSLAKDENSIAMYGYDVGAFVTGSWMYITEEANVEVALRFCDYLWTPEGLALSNFGTEGRSFTYDENGNEKYTELVTNNPDGIALDPMTRTEGCLNWSTIHQIKMSENRFPLQQQKDGVVIWSQSDVAKYRIYFYAIPSELESERATLKTEIGTYINEMVANFISGVEPLSNFDQYLANLKSLGMDRYMEIMQQAIDPYYAK